MFTIEHPPAQSQASKLVLERVSKWYQTSSLDVHALDDVTLRIADGEFVCLVGPSGCGKSTLLSLVAGLRLPTSGTVLFHTLLPEPVLAAGRIAGTTSYKGMITN